MRTLTDTDITQVDSEPVTFYLWVDSHNPFKIEHSLVFKNKVTINCWSSSHCNNRAGRWGCDLLFAANWQLASRVFQPLHQYRTSKAPMTEHWQINLILHNRTSCISLPNYDFLNSLIECCCVVFFFIVAKCVLVDSLPKTHFFCKKSNNKDKEDNSVKTLQKRGEKSHFVFTSSSLPSGSWNLPALSQASNSQGSKEINQRGVKVPSVCGFPSKGIKEKSQSHLPPWTSFEISSFNGIISRDGRPFAACAELPEIR